MESLPSIHKVLSQKKIKQMKKKERKKKTRERQLGVEAQAGL